MHPWRFPVDNGGFPAGINRRWPITEVHLANQDAQPGGVLVSVGREGVVGVVGVANLPRQTLRSDKENIPKKKFGERMMTGSRGALSSN